MAICSRYVLSESMGECPKISLCRGRSGDLVFNRGSIYNRRRDIHGRFGGSFQSGISASAQAPVIFLFTGDSGLAYGYKDQWEDGVFLYTGDGQVGDMDFVRGNRAIRDHQQDGRDLHLFELASRRGGQYRYLGQFECAGWRFDSGPDRNGEQRRVVVFLLAPHEALSDANPESNGSRSMPAGAASRRLVDLRRAAYEAVTPASERDARRALRRLFDRSDAVRDYVLARADGKCESCQQVAPFVKLGGEPYLEPHHILRLSDGGPDDPRHVAAICPNCHRRIHFGADGDTINEALRERVQRLEVDN